MVSSCNFHLKRESRGIGYQIAVGGASPTHGDPALCLQAGDNLLLENCGRCSEAEAFAGYIVQSMGECCQIGIGYPIDVRVEWEEATDPAVAVLDTALLPRR